MTVQINDQAAKVLQGLTAQHNASSGTAGKIDEAEILARALAFYNYAFQQGAPAGQPEATLLLANGTHEKVGL
jgi:hypothetical protein